MQVSLQVAALATAPLVARAAPVLSKFQVSALMGIMPKEAVQRLGEVAHSTCAGASQCGREAPTDWTRAVRAVRIFLGSRRRPLTSRSWKGLLTSAWPIALIRAPRVRILPLSGIFFKNRYGAALLVSRRVWGVSSVLCCWYAVQHGVDVNSWLEWAGVRATARFVSALCLRCSRLTCYVRWRNFLLTATS